jgi:hypothetical protein
LVWDDPGSSSLRIEREYASLQAEKELMKKDNMIQALLHDIRKKDTENEELTKRCAEMTRKVEEMSSQHRQEVDHLKDEMQKLQDLLRSATKELKRHKDKSTSSQSPNMNKSSNLEPNLAPPTLIIRKDASTSPMHQADDENFSTNLQGLDRYQDTRKSASIQSIVFAKTEEESKKRQSHPLIGLIPEKSSSLATPPKKTKTKKVTRKKREQHSIYSGVSTVLYH